MEKQGENKGRKIGGIFFLLSRERGEGFSTLPFFFFAPTPTTHTHRKRQRRVEEEKEEEGRRWKERIGFWFDCKLR